MSTSRSAFLKTMAATSLGGGGICGGGRGCAGVAESHAAVIERISEVRVNARRPSVTIRLDHFRLAGHSPPRCWRNSAPCTLAQSVQPSGHRFAAGRARLATIRLRHSQTICRGQRHRDGPPKHSSGGRPSVFALLHRRRPAPDAVKVLWAALAGLSRFVPLAFAHTRSFTVFSPGPKTGRVGLQPFTAFLT